MTTITNKYNLPEPLVRAVMFGQRTPKAATMSVTELIKPPQMRVLEVAHHEEIAEDVSDRIWSLLGSAVHSVLERAQVDNALQEEGLAVICEGWKVTGIPDLYEEPALLSDYKVTSVWAFLGGVKVEWEQQVNLYAYLYRQHGFPVLRVQIVAILRDWQKGRVHDDGYPPAAALCVPVNLWPQETQEAFLHERVLLHQAATTDMYPPCTPAERWERPAKWAVIKRGNKRATKVCGSPEEAFRYVTEASITKSAEFDVHKRAGGSIRCESYCNAASWCGQWAAIQEAQKEADLTYTG